MKKKQHFLKFFLQNLIAFCNYYYHSIRSILLPEGVRDPTHHLRCVYPTYTRLYASPSEDQIYPKNVTFFSIFFYQTKIWMSVHFYSDKQLNSINFLKRCRTKAYSTLRIVSNTAARVNPNHCNNSVLSQVFWLQVKQLT